MYVKLIYRQNLSLTSYQTEAATRISVAVILLCVMEVYDAIRKKNLGDNSTLEDCVVVNSEVPLHLPPNAQNASHNHTFHSRKYLLTGITDYLISQHTTPFSKKEFSSQRLFSPSVLSIPLVVIEVKSNQGNSRGGRLEAVAQTILLAKRLNNHQANPGE